MEHEIRFPPEFLLYTADGGVLVGYSPTGGYGLIAEPNGLGVGIVRATPRVFLAGIEKRPEVLAFDRKPYSAWKRKVLGFEAVPD